MTNPVQTDRKVTIGCYIALAFCDCVLFRFTEVKRMVWRF